MSKDRIIVMPKGEKKEPMFCRESPETIKRFFEYYEEEYNFGEIHLLSDGGKAFTQGEEEPTAEFGFAKRAYFESLSWNGISE